MDDGSGTAVMMVKLVVKPDPGIGTKPGVRVVTSLKSIK
jgi:hypothetical protein